MYVKKIALVSVLLLVATLFCGQQYFKVAQADSANQDTQCEQCHPNGVPQNILANVTTVATTCIYTIKPTSKRFKSGGGGGFINVMVVIPTPYRHIGPHKSLTNCTWTPVASDGWIHITSGASGAGKGQAAYSVDANTTQADRNGTITIAKKTFTISQKGLETCDYTVSPASVEFAQGIGVGAITVKERSGSGCAYKATVTAGADWIHITSGDTGGDSGGAVDYSVDSNKTDKVRVGTITVNPGARICTIRQKGLEPCEYSIFPPASHVKAAGGSGMSMVHVKGSGCTWDAASNVGWIHVTYKSDPGVDGSVNWTADANPDPVGRAGQIIVLPGARVVPAGISALGNPGGAVLTITQGKHKTKSGGGGGGGGGGAVSGASFPTNLPAGTYTMGGSASWSGVANGGMNFPTRTFNCTSGDFSNIKTAIQNAFAAGSAAAVGSCGSSTSYSGTVDSFTGTFSATCSANGVSENVTISLSIHKI